MQCLDANAQPVGCGLVVRSVSLTLTDPDDQIEPGTAYVATVNPAGAYPYALLDGDPVPTADSAAASLAVGDAPNLTLEGQNGGNIALPNDHLLISMQHPIEGMTPENLVIALQGRPGHSPACSSVATPPMTHRLRDRSRGDRRIHPYREAGRGRVVPRDREPRGRRFLRRSSRGSSRRPKPRTRSRCRQVRPWG